MARKMKIALPADTAIDAEALCQTDGAYFASPPQHQPAGLERDVAQARGRRA